MFLGGMYYPFPWHTSNYDDNLKARDPETMNPWRVNFETELPAPNGMKICEEHCEFHMGREEFFSNNAEVKIVTLDEDMYDDKMSIKRPRRTKYYPWAAPGQARTPCNDGCGVNGGNPCGCNEEACENSEETCPNSMYKIKYVPYCTMCDF